MGAQMAKKATVRALIEADEEYWMTHLEESRMKMIVLAKAFPFEHCLVVLEKLVAWPLSEGSTHLQQQQQSCQRTNARTAQRCPDFLER
mmetsp:Transcript_22367/g.40273  ORF Transcript_22367/g.40273 Transcript_22367/m.40273 type:complete len:89 (+) Transcript_22367:2475-2741(+)